MVYVVPQPCTPLISPLFYCRGRKLQTTLPSGLPSWLPIRCCPWEALAGIWEMTGRKKSFSLGWLCSCRGSRSSGAADAEATEAVVLWARPACWASANWVLPAAHRVRCPGCICFSPLLQTEGGCRCLQLLIYGNSHLPTSPLALPTPLQLTHYLKIYNGFYFPD